MCVNLKDQEGRKIPVNNLNEQVPMYQVLCKSCGPVPLTFQEYKEQVSSADSPWVCPECKEVAEWDDGSGIERVWDRLKGSLK